jgi:N6-L-threonylcarbamoyladenine synthase
VDLKHNKRKIILGIETSCDDTSVCIMELSESGQKILSLNSYNQDFLLAKWGGVVPELAARSHVKAIPPLLEVSFKEAAVKPEEIDEIAVTTHPGLVGSLLTGINLAKTFALVLETPIVPVNHLFAHLEAIHLTEKVSYPYMGLLVSGGHTVFFWVTGPNKAKLGDISKYSFPISYMRDRPGKMSYSGLKTALKVKLQKMTPEEIKTELPHLCAGYQEAIVQTLKVKAEEIIEKVLHLKVKTFETPIVIGGGVACNSRLRTVMQKHFKNVHVVSPIFCTDNAAMVANWAARVPELLVSFPECLSLDAQSRYVEKK